MIASNVKMTDPMAGLEAQFDVIDVLYINILGRMCISPFSGIQSGMQTYKASVRGLGRRQGGREFLEPVQPLRLVLPR